MTTLLNDPEPRPIVQPEPPTAHFRHLIKWGDDFIKFRKFLRTRRFVREGQALHDWTSEQLAASELMGPLSFNVYQTALATLPSHAWNWLADTVAPVEPPSLQPAAWLGRLGPEFIKVAPTIEKFLAPFVIPTALLVLSMWLGWAALRRRDVSKATVRRSRDAYLYLDGAYGMAPEAGAALAFTILSSLTARDSGNIGVASAAAVLLVCSSILGLYVNARKIPSRLFGLNGYTSAPPRFFSIRLAPDAGPWHKYSAAVVFGGIVLIPVFLAISVIGFAAALLLAAIRVALRSLF